ncbi:MAG: glycosyltransferase family 39 protein [Candidatus Colwellbacteria bacterium]|nr:glycosyltransferase family 39 protein [Candidatus Colwellbacteria bacterium]
MKKISLAVDWLVLAAILTASLVIMFTVSNQESLTTDEKAHIPAGYGYVKYLDYRLNPEHPPIVKTLSAIPLTFMNLSFPDKDYVWTTDVNGQWATGEKFIFESGNDAEKLIQWARVGPMVLTLLLILFTYIWSKELLGRGWAFLPTILVALSPTILTHGHLVTTDIGAALGIGTSIYFFVKFLLAPSQKHLVLAGLAFGLAQLLKFSAILLIPYFILLLLLFYILGLKRDWEGTNSSERLKRFFVRGFRYARSLIIILGLGFMLVYPVYFLTTLNYPKEKQITDTEYILQSFYGGPPKEGEKCRLVRCVAELDIWAAKHNLTRPYAEYLLGILMVGQRATGGNSLYFLGDLRNTGGPLYFPIVFLMKEPLPSLLLIFLSSIFFFYKILPSLYERRIKIRDSLLTNFPEVAMGLFILVYVIYSLRSPLNIGLRHLIPIMPLTYILTAVSIKSWMKTSFVNAKIKVSVVAILFAVYIWDSFSAYPHYLPYFNDLIQTNNGWKYVTDSNYDWGQDLKRLVNFVNNPPQGEKIDKIAIDYFGGASAKYYLGDKAVSWSSSKGNPLESDIKWLAISINTLQGAKGKLRDNLPRTDEDEYRWLKNPYRPHAIAGKSIFIYKLE